MDLDTLHMRNYSQIKHKESARGFIGNCCLHSEQANKILNNSDFITISDFP